MGARIGCSILHAGFVSLLCFSGTVGLPAWAVPIDAGMAIVLWIGLVITAQAFQATPQSHAPAVVVGILPGVAAWGTRMAKNGVRAAWAGAAESPGFTPALVEAFRGSDTWIHGAFSLEQGFISSAMILAALTVGIIERRFQVAGRGRGGARRRRVVALLPAGPPRTRPSPSRRPGPGRRATP